MSGRPDDLPPAPPAGALELAGLLSFATRIEPELMRAARLRFLPRLDAGAEADLWFSDWVGARTSEAIALLPAVLPRLRAGLVERLRSEPELGEVFALVEAYHRDLSPALLLEERVTWHSLTGDLDTATRQLDRALHALVRENRSGLAGWFAEAWHRLPDQARATTSAWSLAHASRPHVPPFDAGQPPQLALADLAAIAGTVGEARLGVLREGTALLLGQVRGRHAAAVLVPDTAPRLVEVVTGSVTRTVPVAEGAVVRIEVGGGRVALRTGAGLTYRLAPAPAPSAPRTVGDRVDALIRRLRPDMSTESLPWLVATVRELLDRFRREEDPAALEEAVRLSDRLQAVGYRAPVFPALRIAMAEAYLSHGLNSGRRRSLEQARDLSGMTLDRPSPESDLAARAVHGAALRELYAHTGDTDLLAAALGTLTPVTDRRPPDHPADRESDYRRIAAELLSTYADLYEAAPHEQILRNATDLLDRVGPTARDEAVCALPLARLLLAHHDATGDPAALRRAERLARAGESPTEPKEVQSERNLLLARCCLARFRPDGSRETFDRALEHARWAVSLAPPGSPTRRARPHLVLSDLLRLRFALTRRRESLDEAVAVIHQVLEGLPTETPWYGIACLDLARCRADGYRHSGRQTELEAAHQACRIALQDRSESGPASAHRWAAHALEAECLLLTYRASGNRAALQAAVYRVAEAWGTRVPAGHPPAWYPTEGLVSALLEVEGDDPGAEELIDLLGTWEQEVQASEPEHRAFGRAALSSIRLVRATLLSGVPGVSRFPRPSVAEEAQRSAQDAVQPLRRLQALLVWGESIVQLGFHHEEMVEAYERATLELAPLTLLSPDPRHQGLVASWERLSREAAACAIDADRPDLALEILEQRGRVLAGAGVDRGEEWQSAPVAEVRWLWAYLHLDTAAVASLHRGDDGPLFGRGRSPARERIAELADTFSPITGSAAFGPAGSLAAQTFHHPASVASEGPVVVLNEASFRCAALLVTRQGVAALPLPDAGPTELRDRVRRFESALLDDPSQGWNQLGWLWESVVRPVLNALGLAELREPVAPARDEALPRMWWCPTGLFTRLPLHAAGRAERSAMNHAVHSYTPSLQALAHARYRERRADDDADQSMLLVQAEGDGPPGLTDTLRELVPDVRTLRGPRTTMAEITAHLPAHPFFHYSGHPGAYDGAFLLHVPEGLGRRRLPRDLVPDGELAYLWPCDTAGGASDGEGDGWTIAASFHSAGFRHVVGVLAAVRDEPALRFATPFYALLRTPSGRLKPEHAARALHHVVQIARVSRHPDDFAALQIMTMVHLGP